jgi:hypothetical protein
MLKEPHRSSYDFPIGLLDDDGALQNFQLHCLKALLQGRTFRHLSDISKEFYTTLMQNGGHMLHDWVSKMFMVPSASTTWAWKAAIEYAFILRHHPDLFDSSARLIGVWGMKEMPFILAEDGSALQIQPFDLMSS